MEESNLGMLVSERERRGHKKGKTHWFPLAPGLEASLRKPVYSMVTMSPALGLGPEPSAMMFLVTPMMKVWS